jgi:hypothetical protein
VVTPLVVPLEAKVPVAVVPKAKHDDEVPKLRLVIVTAPALPCDIVMVKVNAVVLSGLTKVADQLPLTVLLELPPQAVTITIAAHKTAS